MVRLNNASINFIDFVKQKPASVIERLQTQFLAKLSLKLPLSARVTANAALY